MNNDRDVNENYHIFSNAINEFSKEQILSIYRDMCRLRKFEEVLIECINKNGEKLISRVHMSSGQEAVGVALAHTFSEENFFVTHRCVELFISLGVPLELVRDEILCLDTGCLGGKAGSLYSYVNNNINIYSHTGFIGEQIPIATGFALASGKKTICISGDGGAEEDYALQAYGFAATHNLPILFVCNDNDLSVMSTVKSRRSWNLPDIANAFGLKSFDVADDPFTLIKIFKDVEDQLPAFINVRVNREFKHSGITRDEIPKWNRHLLLKKQIIDLGYSSEISEIEELSDKEMRHLWRKYL